MLATASVLFLFRIGQHPFWSDELLTAEIVVHQSQSEIWNPRHPGMEGGGIRGCMVPYYSAAKIWCSTLGSSEAGLRSLSAVSALVALAMILALGPSFWGLGRRASLVAAVLFTLSPMMLWYAQEARYYAFLQPISLAVCSCYFQFWRTWRWQWLAIWVIVSVFALMAHPFMIFGIVAISCYGMWVWWKGGFARRAIVILSHGLVAGYFLAVMRLLTTSYDRISTTEHAAYTLYTDDLMPWRVLSNFLCGVYEHGSLIRSNDAIMASLLLIAATVLLVLHVQAGFNERKKDAVFWMAASLGACALMISVSWFRPFMVEGKRYVMVFFAPFCVCLAMALVRMSSFRLTLPLFIGVMALNSMTVEREYFSPPQKQNWRLAGESIRKHSSAGDVWLHQSTPRAFASEYYGGYPSSLFQNLVWEPTALNGQMPSALMNAKRVWLVKTGSIADVYGVRLEKAGFRRTNNWILPSGRFFQTQLWLFERTQ